MEYELTRLRAVAKEAEDEANNVETTLATSESLKQKLGETLVRTEQQFVQMHSQFEEAERIWKEEFMMLADRLNEHQ